MPLMIKLNRNVVRVYLCLDNGHFITVFTMLTYKFGSTKLINRMIEILRHSI